MDAATRLSRARIPLCTLLVCAAAAVVYASTPLQALLIYDRAAIGAGELWRLATGNLVHHSATHFAFDVAALLIAGTLVEVRRPHRFTALCLACATLVGTWLYLGKPDIVVFGGLSGVVTAALTYLCLRGLYEVGPWRWLCLAVLAGVAAKIGADMTMPGSTPLFAGEPQDFVLVPESHLAGAATALVLFLLTKPAAESPRS